MHCVHDWWTHFKQQVPWQMKPSGMWHYVARLVLHQCFAATLHYIPQDLNPQQNCWEASISQVHCQRRHSSEQGGLFRRNFRWYWSTLRSIAMEISRTVIPGRVPHSFKKFWSHLWIFGASWETRKFLLSTHSTVIPEPQYCLTLSARFLWTDLHFACKKTNLW